MEGPVDVEVQVESNRSEVHLGEDLWLEYADGKSFAASRRSSRSRA